MQIPPGTSTYVDLKREDFSIISRTSMTLTHSDVVGGIRSGEAGEVDLTKFNLEMTIVKSNFEK